MPSDPNANARVRIAFFCLFVLMIVSSVGAYFATGLGKPQKNIAVRESQAASQGAADANRIDEALREHPSDKFLQMIAMATKAANETSAAAEKLSNEVEPPAISKEINLGAASRSDLEALGRDLKTAEANAATFMPRYAALLKTERDDVERYALSLYLEKDAISRFLGILDKRHAESTAFTSRQWSARADFYRAYENYVAVLVGEFGSYRVVDGQFIFTFQRAVDRYDVAAHAMTVAAKRVAELGEERRDLVKAQQEQWEQLVHGK